MYENVPAQSANENNEEKQKKVDGNLIIPTSSMISQNEVRGLRKINLTLEGIHDTMIKNYRRRVPPTSTCQVTVGGKIFLVTQGMSYQR